MKKIICTVLALAMLAAPMTAYAEKDAKTSGEQEKKIEALTTMMDHIQEAESWQEELVEWFNVYLERVENGETLTENEMGKVFSYAYSFIETLRLWQYEASSLSEDKVDDSAIEKLKENTDLLKDMYTLYGVSAQKECMDTLSALFTISYK
nr:MAG TPA: hypothetical protein [Caudoviricetes sp.]